MFGLIYNLIWIDVGWNGLEVGLGWPNLGLKYTNHTFWWLMVDFNYLEFFFYQIKIIKLKKN
jgi:hypothetical protein